MDSGETKDCALPPPLTEDEISAVVDGRPSRHARAHLRRCAYCSARVAQAQRIESSLSRALHRFDCPPAQRLGDYAFGLLGDAEAQAITLHLETCARCTSDLAEMRVFVNADSPAEQVPAPEAVTTPSWQRRIQLPRIPFDEIIAKLLPQSPALAYRGSTSGREPLVAEVDDTVITLDVQPDAQGQVQVTGMLSSLEPEHWAGALALFWMEGEVRAATTLDENGGFTFEPLPVGTATLRIAPEHGPTVVVADLHLA